MSNQGEPNKYQLRSMDNERCRLRRLREGPLRRATPAEKLASIQACYDLEIRLLGPDDPRIRYLTECIEEARREVAVAR